MIKSAHKLLMFACIVLLAAVLSGCALTPDGRRGHAVVDMGLMPAFNDYQYDSAYTYYLYAVGNNYYALLGLTSPYTVTTGFTWQELPLGDPEFRKVSNFMWQSLPNFLPRSLRLYDDQNREIGVIFISVTFSYIIGNDNVLTFYIDQPWNKVPY